MVKKTHEDVMALLKSVPGVIEHLNSPSVIKEKVMAKQRIELGRAYDFLFEKENNDNDEYADHIKEDKKICGYELTVIFDKDSKFTDEESDALCEKIMGLFTDSNSVNIKFSPIIEE